MERSQSGWRPFSCASTFRGGNGRESSRFSQGFFSSADNGLLKDLTLSFRGRCLPEESAFLFHPSLLCFSDAFPRTDTLHGGMTSPFCNVALPVPLRTTFTYAIPESLQGTLQPGSRVLVPFRKKAMVGVVVELTESAPQETKIREITRVLDFVPALTPKLLELAHWIAGYYLAPVGEVFRAMLPPVTELKSQRQIILTDAGREAAGSLSGGELSHGLSSAEAASLAKLKEKKGTLLLGRAAKLGVDASALQRLQRLRLVEIRETVQGRNRRTQRVIAWNGGAAASTEKEEEKDNAETQSAQNRREEVEEKSVAETQSANRKHKEERVREL